MSQLHDTMCVVHRTDAHALAAVLEAVDAVDQPTLSQRWSQVLKARHGSQEFAQRHAEVVGLLTGTMKQVVALPDDKRKRYEPYFMSWWSAVLTPEMTWTTQSKGTKVISPAHLALLHGVGDLVEARMEHTPSSPGAYNLDQIAAHCAEWMEVLQVPGTLPEAFRRSLIQAISHVQWLIENVGLVGVSRVAEAANVVTGTAVQAIPHAAKEERQGWAKRLASWTATLMAFSAFNLATAEAIESTERLVVRLSGVAEQVMDALERSGGATPNPPEVGGAGGED